MLWIPLGVLPFIVCFDGCLLGAFVRATSAHVTIFIYDADTRDAQRRRRDTTAPNQTTRSHDSFDKYSSQNTLAICKSSYACNFTGENDAYLSSGQQYAFVVVIIKPNTSCLNKRIKVRSFFIHFFSSRHLEVCAFFSLPTDCALARIYGRQIKGVLVCVCVCALIVAGLNKLTKIRHSYA